MLTTLRLADIRKDTSLLSLDEEHSMLHVLLPVAQVDAADAGRPLEQLGFRRAGSNISWMRRLHSDELGQLEQLASRVQRELGGALLLDLGAVFTNKASPQPVRAAELPPWWHGKFLIHVRGTPRCLVFDGKAQDSDVRRVYDLECARHTVHELEQTE
jgi:hypothetical protein